MFTINELSERVAAYRAGTIGFEDFEEWYRDHSWGMYDRAGDKMSDLVAVIEAAFSSYELDEINECTFQEYLSDAVNLADARVRELSTVPREYAPQRFSVSSSNPYVDLQVASIG